MNFYDACSGEGFMPSLDSDEGILKPLHFTLKSEDSSSDCDELQKELYAIDCLVCTEQFTDAKEFCQHMLSRHKIVIAEPQMIALFSGYASYWKAKFNEKPYTEICTRASKDSLAETTPEGEEAVYLLGSSIPEDKLLRERLKRKRLELVLKQHEKERTDDSFSRRCFFCSKEFKGNRAGLFRHMSEEHNLSVGLPDNIVFVNEFLDLLEKRIEKDLQCLFCEKIFRDRGLLKEHMRKKMHKHINPHNKEFDKFYLINYLELGKNWEAIQAEDDSELQDGDNDTEELWGDWQDTDLKCVCLFCELSSSDADIILLHMKETHQFDLWQIKEKRRMNYYQQVKLINYIRRQMMKSCCFSCLHQFDHHDELIYHLMVSKHTAFLPDAILWDQPQYYFPTYENDNLLCALEDDGCDAMPVDGHSFMAMAGFGSGGQSGDSLTVLEEISVSPDSVLWNEEVRRQLM